MGGVSPYTFHWSNYATDSCISNLYAGNYYCTVSDASGCQIDTTIHLQNVNSINIVLDSLININCENHNNFGSIYVHGINGIPPYSYIWSHGAITSAITNLSVGNYSVTVIDNQGCSSSMTFHIQNTYNLYSSITATDANCTNNNGTATITASGIHPPFTYLWSDSLHQTTPTSTQLSSGNYSVTVTDNIGCTMIAYTSIHFFNYNVIKGRIYMDDNQNCIQDNGELGIQNHTVKVLPANNCSYTNASGDYILFTNQLNNSVAVSNYYSDGNFPTCPSNSILNVNFTNTCGDTSYNNDFGYYYNPDYFNLRISPSWTSAHPGFNKIYKLYGYNNSATAQNALLRLTYDTVLQYISSNFNGVYNSTLHTVEWTANNISPYSYVNNNNLIPMATFYVPTTISITDTLCALFEIFPTTGDIYPHDNSISICQPVTGSYDPNSKEVFPTGQGTKGYITTNDSVLFYTIHFQNTGNDTCFTVEIADTLSSYLEPASIEMGASSHPCTTTLKGTGILSFRFDNILLPDSNTNPEESSGFVNYMVHLKPNLPLGTVINNTAYIVFDFNAPVVTNTTVNTITSFETIANESNHTGVRVYPNPFKDFTTFYVIDFHQGEKYSLEIFDMLGKSVLLFENIHTKTFNVYSTHLESGIYFYKVSTFTTEIAVGKISVE